MPPSPTQDPSPCGKFASDPCGGGWLTEQEEMDEENVNLCALCAVPGAAATAVVVVVCRGVAVVPLLSSGRDALQPMV